MKKSIKKKIQERKWYLIILSIFWLYVIGVLQCFNITNTEYNKSNYTSNSDICWEQPLLAGEILEQEIEINEIKLSKLGITFGTYARENNSSLHIVFREKEKDILYDQVVSCSELQDWGEFVINLNGPRDVEKGTYVLSIESIDGIADNAVSVLCTNSNTSISKLKRNNVNTDNVICIKSYYNGSIKVGILKILVYTALIILSYGSCLWINAADEKTFVYLALIWGFAFIILNPVFHILDESTHYFRSFAISTGQWLDSLNETGDIGAFVPVNYSEIHFQNISLKTVVTNFSLYKEAYSSVLGFQVNPYAASYLPINHAIAAIGIFIGYRLGLPAFIVIYFARLSVLLVYTGLCYLAIKKAKYYKSVFFVVALLPASMWLAGSCSQDPIINGASLLFISICLNYKWGDVEFVSLKDLFWLIVCGTSIASVKYLIYTPILLLFFVIPKEKFKKNERNIMIVIASCIVLFCLVGQVLLMKKFPYTEDRNGDVDVARQVKFILANPYNALCTFSRYAMTSIVWHIENFKYESATGFFATTASLIGIAGTPVIAKDKYEWKKEETKFRKVLSILMFFIIVVVTSLTIVALYVGFTPVGASYVDGLQTRYFIPIVLFLMILIANCKVENKIEKYELFLPNLLMLGLLDTLIGITCKYL